MKVLFDTSVLVPAFVDQLSNHPTCFSTLVTYTSGHNTGVCASHALAEVYSVLTALPVPRRVSPLEARQIIEESILGRLSVIDLDAEDYRWAVTAVSDSGLTSGIVYDGLHLAAARKAGCSRIYTYNVRHFARIASPEIEISAP